MAQRFKAKTLLSNSGVFNNEVIAPNLIYHTGDQTINGIKAFISRPTVNGTGILLSGEAGIVPSTVVQTSGTQIISGAKTFTTGVVISGNLQVSGTGIFNAIALTNRPTVNGTGVLLSGDIPYVQTNSYFYVDATRTDSYIENGNILYPYKTLSGAYNAAKNIAYFHNPTYITLLSPIAENLTIDKGYINLVGNNTNKNDPIRITGSLVFAATGGTATDNNFSIAGLGITATSNNKCILFSGNNPQRLFIQDCWLIAKDNGTCLYSNNTNTTSRLQGDILKLSPEGVNTTAIDIVSGTSSISFAETSSSASVLAYVRNNSTLNISNSQIETTGAKAFQVENAARLTLLNSVLTNTAYPSTGIFLKDPSSTAVVVGSAISVPANASSYAINGVAYSYLFYKNLYFSIDAAGQSTESKIGNNVNKNLINSYDPVVYSIGNQTISGIKTFVTGIVAPNLVYNTGDQTISGVKTFATGVVVSGNLQVSGSGIFNSVDLNNVDTLSLSGVDISITNGNVALTNRPTVNGTGVLLSGSAPFVMNFGHARNDTTAGSQYYYFGPQMDIDPAGIGSNERRRVQILQDCFLRKIVWTSFAKANAPTPSNAMTGYFKNFGNNALTDDPSSGIQVTSAINIPSTNTMYSNSTGTLNIPITGGNYVSFYYKSNFNAGSNNQASGLGVNVYAYFE